MTNHLKLVWLGWRVRAALKRVDYFKLHADDANAQSRPAAAYLQRRLQFAWEREAERRTRVLERALRVKTPNILR